MIEKWIFKSKSKQKWKEATYKYGENSKLACQTRHKCIHNEQPR